MSTTPKAIGYVRVSTQDQATGGHSLASQIEACTAAAVKRGMSVVIIQDVISGSTLKRPGLDEARAMLASGDANVLIVQSQDRLMRGLRHLLNLIHEGKTKGWSLVCLDNDIDTTTPAGEAMFNMQAVFAQQTLGYISERTKLGLDAARKAGRIGGRVRMEASTVDAIKSLSTRGMSANAIAAKMTSDGIPTTQGGKWYAQTICRVLQYQ